ncbi:ABC transporter permease [Roseateles sp. DC23W]|uniref:ABC transporter permease n=1 Tax=Pelomonas dachongensis TaxID=3299029 RepID=A0ABW7EU68_9BURK
MSATAAITPAAPARKSDQALFLLFKLRTFIALFAVVGFFSAAAPNFLSADNALIMAKHVALNAFLAIGMTYVIVSGGIDLSVGSTVGLAGMVAGFLILNGLPVGDYVIWFNIFEIIGIALLLGVAIGGANGLLITRLNVAPFIATLGMLYVARGAALLISDGATFANLGGKDAASSTGFPLLGTLSPLGIPLVLWLLVVIGLAATYLGLRTPIGRHIYAVGGNERAAQLSGVQVRRVKMVVYMISGGLAALVGLIIASQLEAAHPLTGETFELNAIAAAVLGGTSMSGGRGRIGGTIVGAFVIGILSDGLVMMGVSSFWQTVIKGVVIIAAVVVDQAQQRMQQRLALQQSAATA